MNTGETRESEQTKVHEDKEFIHQTQQSEKSFGLNLEMGSYKLLQEIGSGSFARVYKAQHLEASADGKDFYAIKILKPGLSKKALKQFKKEAELLKSLNHKAFPKFFEEGIAPNTENFQGAPYIVMEFVEGRTLQEIMAFDPPELDTALLWLYELAAGLDYIHNHGIIHCDLKPANIKISWNKKYGCCVRILDLGIALLRQNQHSQIIGSLRYMSPEQVGGKKILPASDIYAFGLIAYELLFKRYPYQIDGVQSLAQWQAIHQHTQPQAIQNKEISDKVIRQLRCCLDKKPKVRPKSKQINQNLAAELSQIYTPKYIGIVGSRGAGKTCYMVSLYHEAETNQETKDLLEDRYIDLYEKGILPEATALYSYNLNYKITDGNRFFDIFTKDYGGELLQGRKNEGVQGDQELIGEQREQIYQFFQQSMGIVILVETNPHNYDFKEQINRRNEIEDLVKKLDTIQEGIREINIPIALVLSKWDRMSDLSYDDDKENKKAEEYVEKSPWLRPLRNKLVGLCGDNFKIFPVFSFIGDKPSIEDLRPFNLCHPLLWIANRAEKCLLDAYQRIEKLNPENYAENIERYWQLLHIQKVSNTEIRQLLKRKISSLSDQYLKYVDRKAKKYRQRSQFLTGQYKELVATKGIDKSCKEEAEAKIEKLEKSLVNKNNRKIFAYAAVILILFFVNWNIASYITVKLSLYDLDEGKSPQKSHIYVKEYLKYSWLRFLTNYFSLDDRVKDEYKQVKKNTIDKEYNRKIKEYNRKQKEYEKAIANLKNKKESYQKMCKDFFMIKTEAGAYNVEIYDLLEKINKFIVRYSNTKIVKKIKDFKDNFTWKLTVKVFVRCMGLAGWSGKPDIKLKINDNTISKDDVPDQEEIYIGETSFEGSNIGTKLINVEIIESNNLFDSPYGKIKIYVDITKMKNEGILHYGSSATIKVIFKKEKIDIFGFPNFDDASDISSLPSKPIEPDRPTLPKLPYNASQAHQFHLIVLGETLIITLLLSAMVIGMGRSFLG